MASPGQPVFSIVQTAGVRKILTAADFNAVSPFYASVSFVQLLTKIEVNYDAPTPGPHWLIISPDRTQTAIAVPTAEPLWIMQVYPNNQASPANTFPVLPNRESWFQPLACSQVDLYFQSTRYPGIGGLFKPSALTLSLEYYASRLV